VHPYRHVLISSVPVLRATCFRSPVHSLLCDAISKI